VINRIKEFGILMSDDGPDHNLIKIKPPLTFTKENAQEVVFYLHKIFGEDVMKII
jgi:4-aminobutyrate aminotransferase-like enzyme